MLVVLLNVVISLGPVGVDFSAISAEPGHQRFEYWLVVHATNGKTFDYGERCKSVATSGQKSKSWTP